jgi:hypothetical protein
VCVCVCVCVCVHVFVVESLADCFVQMVQEQGVAKKPPRCGKEEMQTPIKFTLRV